YELVFSVGEVLQVDEELVGEVSFFAVDPYAEFEVPAEVAVVPFGKGEFFSSYLSAGIGPGGLQVYGRKGFATGIGYFGVDGKGVSAGFAEFPFSASE